ncbi:MAG: hypothetical protein U9R56_08110 [candidate division Zixibacteria bacterium]|nr:hypothetical protein [candidate division Zixibacteria bacterium]
MKIKAALPFCQSIAFFVPEISTRQAYKVAPETLTGCILAVEIRHRQFVSDIIFDAEYIGSDTNNDSYINSGYYFENESSHSVELTCNDYYRTRK